MGLDDDFGIAFYKSQQAAYTNIPGSGKVFVSVKDSDKPKAVRVCKVLHELGYTIVSTVGTSTHLAAAGIETKVVKKIVEGNPNISDQIRAGEIALLINTPTRKGPSTDEAKIRSLAVSFNIPCITTIKAAEAVARAMIAVRKKGIHAHTLQEYQSRLLEVS